MRILVEGLTFTYPAGSEPAVRELSFSVGEGEIFGFLGPSGAGKSTTQKILVGLLERYSGRAEVLGRDLSSWRNELYERIGVSFELPNHFSKLTALENLDFFGRLYRAPVRSTSGLLEAVDLGNAGEIPVGQFSKGMKVRLGVVRALLHSPEILFLDEPTAGLDPVSSRRIRDLIRAERDAGRTVFLTTHDMVTADELCDRVAFIVDGEIAGIGPPGELKLAHGRRRVRVEYVVDDAVAVAEFGLDTLGRDAQFLALLNGAEVRTIHTAEATLEQVFVEVTGRGLA